MRHVPPLAVAALLVALLPTSSRAADAKALAGRWSMVANPSTILTLGRDGTGSLGAEPIRWQLHGDRLVVTDRNGGSDTNTVRVQGDQLAIVGAGGATVLFTRVGADAGKKQAASAALPRGAGDGGKSAARDPGAKTAGAAGSATDKQLRELLLSSAWCSFSYSSTPGGGGSGSHSSSSRVVFRKDGTAVRGTSSETYSTGTGGQYAGARQGAGGLRWEVKAGRLLVDTGEGQGFQDVNLNVTRNSNGYPILNAAGTEYMMCR
jgi:hypothetical protein